MRKVNRTESGCTLSASAGSLALERVGATGRYSVLSRGLALAESGRSAALAAPDGSASQLWGLSDCGDYYELRSTSGLALNLANASAAEGNPARLCEPYGTRDQRRALSPAPSATYSVAYSWDEL